ncbi:MAG: SDR family NAD(P)-dependent oxidoreductase [Pseudomonadota bacterium]
MRNPTDSRPTTLVTGASSGIGLAIAERLHADGHRVIALARREQHLADLAAAAQSDRLHTVAADITDRGQVTQALATLPPDFADIDILVNNAGLALGLDSSAAAAIDDWDTMIDVNCRALVWLTRQVLPRMLERGAGHVINMGSTAGRYAYRGSNVYGASKAFVAQFTANLRADLLGTAIRSTLIEPGLVGGSEFSNVRFHGDDDEAASVYAGTEPLLPADIAAAVAWVVAQPAHVNVNRIELMPVCQAVDSISVARHS